MMTLVLASDMHAALWAHLLPRHSRREQAAFLFCGVQEDAGSTVFDVMDTALLGPGDFAAQYNDYIEITDECRIALIKRAHNLGAALAEFHSHPGPWPAAFSVSDRYGLSETVPHMRWRLKGRPYLAVVVAPTGFDALAWLDDSPVPSALSGIRVGSMVHLPTNASLEGWEDGPAGPL